MTKKISGLNYEGRLSADDWEFQSNEVEKEILNTRLLASGFNNQGFIRYGVVDNLDPLTSVPSDSTRPLVVSPSTSNVLHIDVTSGICIQPSGALARLDQTLDLPLARTSIGDILVVFVETELIDSLPSSLNRYNDLPIKKRKKSTHKVKSALITSFLDASVFNVQRKENITVLAVVSVAQTLSGVSLLIDMSQTAYAFNRPWYSIVDSEHRSFLGSGFSTPKNPHGTTLNDLSAGSIPFYTQIAQTGLVLSLDFMSKGLPGKLCAETISPSRILVDVSGSITALSPFGGVGSKYINLASYPTVFSSMYAGHKSNPVAADWIQGTRIVVLGLYETTTEMTAIYSQASAGLPPSSVLSNTLVSGQPIDGVELIFSGGTSLTTISNPNANFEGSGPIPRKYTTFVTDIGTILKVPEQVRTPILLDSIGTSVFPISYSPLDPTNISIGLADASSALSMQISIKVSGILADGSAADEVLSFSAGDWISVPIGGGSLEDQKQIRVTSNLFASLTSIQAISRIDDGPASKILIWGEYLPGSSSKVNSYAALWDVFWDGTAIHKVLDVRLCKPAFFIEPNRYSSAAELVAFTSGSTRFYLSEDLTNPIHKYTVLGTQTSTKASFSVKVNSLSLVTAGDQFVIGSSPAKTLTAITTGTPNRTLGEFKAAVSETVTVADIAATLNFAGFSSGIVATVSTSDQTKIDCEVQLSGSRGNYNNSSVQVNPSAISFSNSTGGNDTFWESSVPRQNTQLNSNYVPSPSTYEVFNQVNYYLSKAILLGNTSEITLLLHGISPLTQVRMRVAAGSSSTWLPWEVMSITNNNVEKSLSGMNKMQVAIFGKVSGYSVFGSI